MDLKSLQRAARLNLYIPVWDLYIPVWEYVKSSGERARNRLYRARQNDCDRREDHDDQRVLPESGRLRRSIGERNGERNDIVRAKRQRRATERVSYPRR
jgi:hypothetical protein